MKIMMCGCTVVAMATTGMASIDYVSQSRTYEVYGYSSSGPGGMRSGSASDFSAFDVFARSQGFGPHGEVSTGEITHHSSLQADQIVFATEVRTEADFIGAGQGSAYGRAVLDVTFTLATAQRYDFSGTTSTQIGSGRFGWIATATLEGAGGMVFAMPPHLQDTERLGGILEAGTYRYRVHFEYGDGPSDLAIASFNAVLTIPAPGSVLAVAGGAMFAVRRRRR